MKEIITHTAEETRSTARTFAQDVAAGEMYGLSGDLGVGKTTFMSGMLAALGAEGPYTSPTFTLMKTYDVPAGSLAAQKDIKTIYHIDAYRISAEDMIDLGWQEIVADPFVVVFIEWPEKIISALPAHTKTLTFTGLATDVRTIHFP